MKYSVAFCSGYNHNSKKKVAVLNIYKMYCSIHMLKPTVCCFNFATYLYTSYIIEQCQKQTNNHLVSLKTRL